MGEVVGPAGGETGVPRCLAEVWKLLNQPLFSFPTVNLMRPKALVKVKKRKKP